MKINSKYKIGLRAIKTAIAVGICILLSFIFHREDAMFSSIAAMICIQQTYDQTFETGIHRFIGTILGGIIGYIVLKLICLVPGYNNLFDIIISPICILLVIYICNKINKQDSVIIGCIVLISIIAQPVKNLDDTLIYVINRVIDTLIGIIVAMVINGFFLPKRSKNQTESKDVK